MGRSRNSKNQNTYHYKVIYQDYFEGRTEKLFRTVDDIQEIFKISRSSVYNYYMKVNKNKKHDVIHEIEKLNPPIQRFKRIVVDFD